MNKKQRILISVLRIALGVIFFYAGVSKLAAPNWSAIGVLKGADTFTGFYHWLGTPGMLPITNFLNEWGLTLVGLALIVGLFTRFAAFTGAVIMLLYYFPGLNFPKAGEHSFIVDDHILYAIALLVVAVFDAGRFWGLDSKVGNIIKLKR